MAVTVSLSNADKWNVFCPETEMVVTKKRGRVIFPHLDFDVRGLLPDALYTMHVHLERLDGWRYTFDSADGWKQSSVGEAPLPIREVEHSEGARPGAHWMASSVSFAALKITNDPDNSNPRMIVVQSMHKYQPVLTVRMLGTPMEVAFRIPETQFYAVTQYQNEKVIALKVELNPFAAAFRKNGKKRPSPTPEADDSSQPSGAKRPTPSPPAVAVPQQQQPSFQHVPNHFQHAPWDMQFGGFQPVHNDWNQWNHCFNYAPSFNNTFHFVNQ